MNRHKLKATSTSFVTRYKYLVIPGTLMLLNLTLLVHQVFRVFIGMPDWIALLIQIRDTTDSASGFLAAIAALRKKQTGDTPRPDRDVPPAC